VARWQGGKVARCILRQLNLSVIIVDRQDINYILTTLRVCLCTYFVLLSKTSLSVTILTLSFTSWITSLKWAPFYRIEKIMSSNLRVLVVATILSSAFIPSNEAASQGWWEKATSIIKSDTGQSVVGSLNGAASTALSSSEIGSGLKEALRLGTEKVTKQLGTKNAFKLDKKIHIPLPETLSIVDSTLSKIGMNSLTQELEDRLNVAAEQAAPKAKELFLNAITKMTINDAQDILAGPNDAATSYLRKTMGLSLEKEMNPVIEQTLAQSGAIRAYDQVIGKYAQIPFSQTIKTDLNKYVVAKAMDGIFYYVAMEEAAIRENPAKRTTELLKQVFSAQ
jgi:hypothetical protein